MKREFRAWHLGVGLCVVLGCELGRSVDSGPGTGPEQTATLSSTDMLDGWVRDDGNSAASGSQVIVGDFFSGGVSRGYRGFYSFDLSSIPPGSTITSAALRLYQMSSLGTPYVDLGNVVVDHVVHGDAIDPTDYDTSPLTGNIGVLSSNTSSGYKTLDVANQVRADLTAVRTRAQFRLRFSGADKDSDGTADNVTFTDAEWLSADKPQLVVIYRAPVTP